MPPITPALMSINEFAFWSRIGRTKIYEEINAKRLDALKVGRRTLIPTKAAEAWLASYSAIDAKEA